MDNDTGITGIRGVKNCPRNSHVKIIYHRYLLELNRAFMHNIWGHMKILLTDLSIQVIDLVTQFTSLYLQTSISLMAFLFKNHYKRDSWNSLKWKQSGGVLIIEINENCQETNDWQWGVPQSKEVDLDNNGFNLILRQSNVDHARD